MKRLISIVSLAYLAACGGSESKKSDNRQVRNQAVSTRGFPTQNLGSNSSAKDAKSDGAINAVNKFGDAVDAQMAKDKADAEAQAKDKENQRNLQAAEREKDRKLSADMQSQRLAAKEKGQFMQSLTDMMHMQMMFKMMHPDKCADNWFSGALKGTAGALREAMDTTDSAAAKTANGKPAADVKPGAIADKTGAAGEKPTEKKVDVINPVAPVSPVDAPAATSAANSTGATSASDASSTQVMGPPAPIATATGSEANKVSAGSSESSGSPPPPKT